MKNILKVALLMALTLTSFELSAQKSGRINTQLVVVAMPETATMQTDLEALRKDATDNLETMQVELNNKLQEYQNGQATMNDSIRAMKEKEMQDLNMRMQQFEQSAMQELQQKQQQMLEPILTKLREAINAVSETAGYDVVYDEAAGSVAYFNPTQVVDITDAVKKQLGIQ